MNIGIIGGGSIGLLISSYLSKQHDVTVYVRRKEQKQKINDNGIVASYSSFTSKVKALLIHELEQEDCIIVCVKQSHIFDCLPIIAKLNKDTPVIFLQNGMGHTDLVVEMKLPILFGIIEHGALRKSDNLVEHTGKGKIKLAAYNQADSQLAEALKNTFDQPDFPFQVSDDWKSMLSGKLVANAVINPLTALFDVKNGDVLNNLFIKGIAIELCREATNTLGLDFQEEWCHVQAIVEKTSMNMSSMLKDIKEHRKTEIEAISGFLLQHNKQSIPYTDFVFKSIKALEEKSLGRK